jgi:hypothetical protein
MSEQNPENPENPENPQPPSWTESLDDDLRGFVQNKGFKEPVDVLNSYRNLEKLVGAPKERLLTLPEKEDDENWNQVWNRLGTPEKADDYQLEMPENADEKLAQWAKETFHQLKVPKGMAEGFIKAWNERVSGESTEMKEAIEAKIKQDEESLKKEWGAAYEKNTNIADQAARKFELTKEELTGLSQIMGPAKAMKFLHKLGQGVGESQFVGGDSTNDAMTPEQARGEIANLMNDGDFRTRLQNGESSAKQKWDRLHKYAYPGEMSI